MIHRPVLRMRQSLSTAGLLVGTLFLAFSLSPSLVPRSVGFQGVVSGFSLAAGYAFGATASWFWRYMELPTPGPSLGRRLLLAAGVLCTIVAAIFLWRASEWQNSVRLLMGLDEVEGVRPISIAAISLPIFAGLLFLARQFRRTIRFLSKRLGRFVPRRVAYVVGVYTAAAIFWVVADGVVFTAILRLADSTYHQLDSLVHDDLEPPTGPARTGSPESLIDWHDLGRQGRSFVSTGPTGEEIGMFIGEAAPDPIRVYVGLNAAETARERARLALDELLRVGAFDRSVLILVTPTGTGWVDPAAIDPVEYLLRGDVATVAAQYSYLPSALALIAEEAYGAEMARALFEEVYGHWTTLPAGSRPKLYLFGISLGALNSDRSFHLYDVLADPFQGALWAGPPFRSETWSRVTAGRDPESPQWLPRFRDGTVVRFMNQDGGLNEPDTEWGPLRIAYLQYASDPVTFFSFDTFYREPDWIRAPRGPDVSPALRWYPAVTMLQLMADIAAGAEVTPPGYGHNYAPEHYIDAWLALIEPEGWGEDEVRRLKALFRSE